MTARLYIDLPLCADAALTLPPAAAKHVQVLRLQPGDELVLFDGRGGEWPSRVQRMGRSDVDVLVGARTDAQRELALNVTLAVGMPANERMDALVEKATELGVASLQPLMCERSVLRLSGERAQRRRAHWQGIAIAASEQSGRTRVPAIEPVRTLADWLPTVTTATTATTGARWLLSPGAAQAPAVPAAVSGVIVLSGPEGGLSPAEESLARAAGFEALSLGARVLRADTAPLAVLAWLGLATA